MNMAIKYCRVPLVSSCVSPYVPLVVCVVVGVVMCNFDILVQGIVSEANNTMRYSPIKIKTIDLTSSYQDLSTTSILSKLEEKICLHF